MGARAHQVEGFELRVGDPVIDLYGEGPGLIEVGQYQPAEGRLDGSGRTQGVAGESLGAAAGELCSEDVVDGQTFRAVVVGGAGAVKVEIGDIGRSKLGITQSFLHALFGTSTLGVRGGDVVSIRGFTQTAELDVALLGTEHKEGGPFPDNDSVSIETQRIGQTLGHRSQGGEAVAGETAKGVGAAHDDGIANPGLDQIASGVEHFAAGGAGGGDGDGWYL